MERYLPKLHLNGRPPSGIFEDVRRGLTSHPKSLPPKYFYDPKGAALFEHITRLPEYYLTRVEQGLIVSLAEELMELVRPQEVIELGPGSTANIRSLIDARSADNHIERYVAFDINERTVQVALKTLTKSHPFLETHGVVGDFDGDLVRLPAPIGRRLVVFFGSTIGNLDPHARHKFLVQIRGHLAPDDRLLLGLDLVKDVAILEAAYNDPGGVTAEFNRNILRVVNRAVHADFRPEAFQHNAFYNQQASRIEMHLAPASLQTIELKALGLSIRVPPNETIWTESSYKFTRESTLAMLQEAGLSFEHWYVDRDNLFALVLAGPE